MSDEQAQPVNHEGPLTGGELNAAVTRAVVRIHTAKLGRGPKKSFSFHNDNLVITVMQQAMTHAEQNLAANGQEAAVQEFRRLLQRTMATELEAAVEEVAGRRVIALLNDHHLDPDVSIQVFILDSALD